MVFTPDPIFRPNFWTKFLDQIFGPISFRLALLYLRLAQARSKNLVQKCYPKIWSKSLVFIVRRNPYPPLTHRQRKGSTHPNAETTNPTSLFKKRHGTIPTAGDDKGARRTILRGSGGWGHGAPTEKGLLPHLTTI